MRYRLNEKAFKKRLVEGGYRGLVDFAEKSRIHRNTLQQLLGGKNVFVAGFQRLCDALDADPCKVIIPSVEPHGSASEKIEELGPVIARLLQADPKLAIVLFGSHAAGNAKAYSDWDLGVLRYPNALSGREYLRLKRVAEEAGEDLPRLVDVVNLNQAPSWFLKGLEVTPIFLAGDKKAFSYFMGVLDGIKSEAA